MRGKQKFAGFTLIELLVVIVIIGILATISVSTFSGYFEKARLAKAQQSYSQIKSLFLAQNASTENNLFSAWFSFDSPGSVNTTSPYIIDQTESKNNLDIIRGSGYFLQDNSDTPLGIGSSLKMQDKEFQQMWVISNSPIDNITTAFWFKMNNLPGQYTPPVFLTSSMGTVIFPDGKARFYINLDYLGTGTSHIETEAGFIEPGKWHYAVGSYDGNNQTLRFYIDGDLIGKKEGVAKTINFSGHGIMIGYGWHGVNQNFDGWLDEVMLFPYAFDGKELK